MPQAKEQIPAEQTKSHGYVLVLGSQGVLGSMIADAFEHSGWTTIRAGRRPESEPGFRRVDLAHPETLERALDELAVCEAATSNRGLVVSTIPDWRMTAETAVLRHGGLKLSPPTR